ncbi:MAG: hypothetical protein AVDCRST_MAG10-1729 [uncultured Acidimicrobiales bacterium]|uniref:Uncharacterized protein n=1 Tax=uncultured Acidimicrobiales bacterium TaxID=310071 RepID=A0A6J4I2M6_9ACTN|nr:MAG: hypothetical protein AVDCRST_MAG10-1729 [uncultured Acidimicrobiales bacterium]
MGGIRITPAGPHEFGVEVTEGQETTSHRVLVPPSLLDDWGLEDTDSEAVVRESFAFLMEREPASSILPEFSLAIIPRYFPEYRDELPERLG